MRRAREPASISEKERIRSQINAQVDEFLRRGGQIETCQQNNAGNDRKSVGGVWHSPDEILSMVDD